MYNDPITGENLYATGDPAIWGNFASMTRDLAHVLGQLRKLWARSYPDTSSPDAQREWRTTKADWVEDYVRDYDHEVEIIRTHGSEVGSAILRATAG